MKKQRSPINTRAKDQAMNSAFEAIAMADLFGSLTYVNPSLLSLWDYSTEAEVLGRPISDFWVTPQSASQIVRTVLEAGVWKGEMTARTRRGRTFDVFVSASIVRDSVGQPLCLVAEFKDVSGQKRAEDRIRRLSSFPELNPNPILEIGRDGTLLYANLAATDLAISLGMSGPADFLPADVDRILEESADRKEDRTCFREKKLGERIFGEHVFYSVEFDSLRVYVLDITQHKRAEEINAQLSRMLDLAPGPIIIHDDKGKFLYVNQRACALHGYSRDEMMALSLKDLVAAPDAAMIEGRTAAALGGEGISFEVMHLKKDGTPLPLLVNVRPSRWGTKEALVSVCTDLTDRKEVEAAARKADKLESLGILAAGIAHDFNNLLSGVFGYMDLAREESPPGGKSRILLDKALASLERAKNLTRELLTFAKGGDPAIAAGDIGLLLRNATRLALSGTPVKVEFEIPSGLGQCEFDADQMEQAVHNIVLNAVQAMLRGGTLTVDAADTNIAEGQIPGLAQGAYVCISFSDTGQGISAQALPHIFDPFFSTKKHGTGLGLSTAYSIVKKHGGVILAESRVGEGATFRVFLPAYRSAAAAASDAGNVASRSRTGGIVLMDDDADILEIVGEMLGVLGYKTIWAQSGDEALERLAEARARPARRGGNFRSYGARRHGRQGSRGKTSRPGPRDSRICFQRVFRGPGIGKSRGIWIYRQDFQALQESGTRSAVGEIPGKTGHLANRRSAIGKKDSPQLAGGPSKLLAGHGA